jgi:hypothetical protein
MEVKGGKRLGSQWRTLGGGREEHLILQQFSPRRTRRSSYGRACTKPADLTKQWHCETRYCKHEASSWKEMRVQEGDDHVNRSQHLICPGILHSTCCTETAIMEWRPQKSGVEYLPACLVCPAARSTFATRNCCLFVPSTERKQTTGPITTATTTTPRQLHHHQGPNPPDLGF